MLPGNFIRPWNCKYSFVFFVFGGRGVNVEAISTDSMSIWPRMTLWVISNLFGILLNQFIILLHDFDVGLLRRV